MRLTNGARCDLLQSSSARLCFNGQTLTRGRRPSATDAFRASLTPEDDELCRLLA